MGTTEGDTKSAAVTSQKVASFEFRGQVQDALLTHCIADTIWAIRNLSSRTRATWVVGGAAGPDGAGKSSVIAGLASSNLTGFAGCATYHLRPTRSGEEPGQIAIRMDKPERGTLISVFKLAYLLVANWAGYLAAVWPNGRRGHLVLFDRYFPDCLVDPRRYRLPASCQRTGCIGGATGSDSQTCTLCWTLLQRACKRRKREVRLDGVGTSSGEVTQRRQWRLANVAVVDAALPLAEVVAEVARPHRRSSPAAIPGKIRDRVMATAEIAGEVFTQLRDGRGRTETATYVAVPGDETARWLLPVDTPGDCERYWRVGLRIGRGRGWHGRRCGRPTGWAG